MTEDFFKKCAEKFDVSSDISFFNSQEEQDFEDFYRDYNEIFDILEAVYFMTRKNKDIPSGYAVALIEDLYELHVDFAKNWGLDD